MCGAFICLFIQAVAVFLPREDLTMIDTKPAITNRQLIHWDVERGPRLPLAASYLKNSRTNLQIP